LIDYALWLVGRRRENGRMRMIESDDEEDDEDEKKDDEEEEKQADEDGPVFA
jgi:hypothetical protein